MARSIYLILFLFTTILLVGFYFTSEIQQFWIAHLSHLGIMLLAGLSIIGIDKGNLPKKEISAFKVNQIVGIVIGVFGLISVSNLIPVLATKLAGIELSGFIKPAEFNRILLTVISISIFEEVLFRRILVQKINNVLGINNAIWISALIFAIAHIYTDTGILSAFVAGAVFAFIYIKTSNIYLSIIAHLLYNLTTYFLTPIFMDYINEINKYSITVPAILIGLGLIFGMIKILNKKTSR